MRRVEPALDVVAAARIARPAADRRRRATCSASSVGRPPRARSVSKIAVAELEAAVERGQDAAPSAATSRAVDPDVAGPAGVTPSPPVTASAVATSRPPIAPSGPRALATVSSHSAAGSLRHVIPPPTWRVSRAPSATNVRMRIDVAIAPSGPIQPSAPVYGPRRTGSSSSRISIARIFGAPVIEPPGNAAAQQVERVAARRQPPGDGRDEVLDGGGPLEPAEPRHADRARAGRPGRGRCAGRRRSSRSRPGPWRCASSSQASARSSAAGPAARPRALDRVGRDDAARDRPPGTAPATPTGSPGGRPADHDRDPARRPRSRYAENSDGSPVRSRR